ncbi:MAG TPA: hypothetical protein VF804_12675 [Holophagaceae bacterium]
MERWQSEIEQPTEGFFAAFAAQLAEADGLRDGVREAVKTLVPRIDWEAYQPHVPHGILGLRAVFRLRPLLAATSFHRLLAIQLHMAAHEGRRPAPLKAAAGSGSWRNLEDFIRARRPGLAYAEAQGFEAPFPEDFARLGALVAPDMANVGHKAVLADHLGDLVELLEQPRATGRRLFGLAAWLAATPEDTFWHRRAAARLEGAGADLLEDGAPEAEALAPFVREVCDLGLVELLDRFAARARAGLPLADLRAALVLAASEKLLDARRDLEGKTAWTLTYLATLTRAGASDARLWAQAAALVNLFPTDEAEDRVRPRLPASGAAPEALLDAVLDAEVPEAMGQAQALAQAGQGEAILPVLAEAASRNDPSFNHAHQILAVAAAADLQPGLPGFAQGVMLVALAKSLANSQGSGDLGRRADRVLAGA